MREGFRFCRGHREAVTLLMRTSIDRGELEPHWQREQHMPFLGRAGAILARVLGRSERDGRLLLQTMNHLIVRYTLSSARELALVTGIHADPATEPSEAAKREAVQVIEDHLVEVARGMLVPQLRAASRGVDAA